MWAETISFALQTDRVKIVSKSHLLIDSRISYKQIIFHFFLLPSYSLDLLI